MVRGPCHFFSPFLGCLSGSAELAWGFVEPLRTYEVRFSSSGCALHPSLCLGWAPWVIPCYVFSWSGGEVSFAFVTGFMAKAQAPPLLLGLRASMGDCHILCGRSGVTRSASDTHRQRCERFPFATGVTGRSYRRLLSPSSSGCRCHGCADSRPRNGLFRVP